MIVSFEENCLVTWNVEDDNVQTITEYSSFLTSVGQKSMAEVILFIQDSELQSSSKEILRAPE